jgi:uncharacterized protein YbjQ (UPF0145 family)
MQLPQNLPSLNDPLVMKIAVACGLLLLIVIAFRIRESRRQTRYAARRREELRKERGYLYMQDQQVQQLAGQIIATSSTPSVAGYSIVRQIEAVFTDGHTSPIKAVEVLKAIAAEKGANAIVNLSTERTSTGKSASRGDAVVIQPPPA